MRKVRPPAPRALINHYVRDQQQESSSLVKKILLRPQSAVLHQRHSPKRSTRSDRSGDKIPPSKGNRRAREKSPRPRDRACQSAFGGKKCFGNSKTVALLGAVGDWKAKEAKLRNDAELEQERQIAEQGKPLGPIRCRV